MFFASTSRDFGGSAGVGLKSSTSGGGERSGASDYIEDPSNRIFDFISFSSHFYPPSNTTLVFWYVLAFVGWEFEDMETTVIAASWKVSQANLLIFFFHSGI